MVERCLSFRVRQFLLLVLVVLLSFGPITRAYADDEGGGGASHSFNSSFGTVWYGPTASGLYVRYGVVANTRYDAAVYCCRGRSFELDDLTPRKKRKLLRDEDFSQFAELFNAAKPELTDDWSGDASIVMAWDSARRLYGETYCWNARYTNDQKIRAQEAIEDVLNDSDTPSGGGSGSGGGNAGTGTNDLTVTMRLYYVGNGDEFAGSSPVLHISQSLLNSIKSVMESHNKPYTAVTINQNNGDLNIWIADHDFTLYMDEGNNLDYFAFDESSVLENSWNRGSNYRIEQNDIYLEANGVEFYTHGTSYNNDIGKWVYNQSNVSYCSDKSRESGGGDDGGGDDGGGGEEPSPPPSWPDPPTVVPRPPDVPTPGDPTEPIPPDPVDPTPGNPWIPIPDEDIQITGQDFQDLIDALNEHCIHLQNSIESNIGQLWDLQSDFFGTQFEDLFGLISENFAWLGNDVITESYNDLKSYLYDLFEWLSEQLNFDVQVEGGQYDDTSVIYWLKQIWASLPTGINTRPTDPVINPDGWWDWLTQLLNNLAADLVALGHDELAGVLETLNQLRSKFPFSLPWDVAALLGLLVGPAVCPEFDIPCYTMTSAMQLQQVGTYHITLEPYETVWQGVRWIETLAFAVYLIMNTSNLMDMVQRTVRPR